MRHGIVGQDYVERGFKPADKIFLSLAPLPLGIEPRALEFADDELRIGRPIFYDQGLQRSRHHTHNLTFGSAKQEAAPAFVFPSAQTRPPWRCITRCTIAKPTPVPSNSSARWSRWKPP